MTRVRISTTVDGTRLAQARELLDRPDSELIDRALAALLETLVAQRETEALRSNPYEDDSDLTWEPPSGPSLPYDGPIPPEVREMARKRRE